jgi:hypothetical protein
MAPATAQLARAVALAALCVALQAGCAEAQFGTPTRRPTPSPGTAQLTNVAMAIVAVAAYCVFLIPALLLTCVSIYCCLQPREANVPEERKVLNSSAMKYYFGMSCCFPCFGPCAMHPHIAGQIKQRKLWGDAHGYESPLDPWGKMPLYTDANYAPVSRPPKYDNMPTHPYVYNPMQPMAYQPMQMQMVPMQQQL